MDHGTNCAPIFCRCPSVNVCFKLLLLLHFLCDYSVGFFTREISHIVPPCNKAGILNFYQEFQIYMMHHSSVNSYWIRMSVFGALLLMLYNFRCYSTEAVLLCSILELWTEFLCFHPEYVPCFPAVPPFKPELISEAVLQKLLKQNVIEEIAVKDPDTEKCFIVSNISLFCLFLSLLYSCLQMFERDAVESPCSVFVCLSGLRYRCDSFKTASLI